jgi:hypothetical protein
VQVHVQGRVQRNFHNRIVAESCRAVQRI